MTAYYGELDFHYPSDEPALDLSWSTDQKAKAIISWVKLEFQQFSEFDFGILEEEYDLENLDELQEEILHMALSTRRLVLDHFGASILASQLDDIVRIVEEDYSEDWLPSDDRIHLDVFEDDAEVQYDDAELVQSVVQDIPDILEMLATLRNSLPETLGHNQGPDFPLSSVQLQKLEDGLSELKDSLERSVDLPQTDIAGLGSQLKDVGKSLGQHTVMMVGTSTLKFSEKFGETTGTWAGRAAIFLIFGEKLLQLVS